MTGLLSYKKKKMKVNFHFFLTFVLVQVEKAKWEWQHVQCKENHSHSISRAETDVMDRGLEEAEAHRRIECDENFQSAKTGTCIEYKL